MAVHIVPSCVANSFERTLHKLSELEQFNLMVCLPKIFEFFVLCFAAVVVVAAFCGSPLWLVFQVVWLFYNASALTFE